MNKLIVPSVILSIGLTVGSYILADAIKFHANARQGTQSVIIGFDPQTRAYLVGKNSINLEGRVIIDPQSNYPLRIKIMDEEN